MTKKAKTKSIGRPPILNDEDVVFVDSRGAKSILQAGSDRRAVINRMIDLGGRATVTELNDAFGFDIRPRLLSLMRQNWIGSAAQVRKTVDLPRRPKAQLT